jgi:hypothetical protein
MRNNDKIISHLNKENEYTDKFTNYFRLGSGNRIVHHISNGRISPWIVYNCDSGVKWLSGLNEEQLRIIMAWIDPEFWQKKFKDYAADAEWVKDILQKAGL